MNEKSKQEAEESADKWIKWAIDHKALTYWNSFVEGYLASAKPREKEIKSLGERCLQLQKDKGNLTDKVRELEQQIEKMKCCENCQHWEGREPIPSLAEEGYYCFNDYPFECKRWELAEELKEIKENDRRRN